MVSPECVIPSYDMTSFEAAQTCGLIRGVFWGVVLGAIFAVLMFPRPLENDDNKNNKQENKSPAIILILSVAIMLISGFVGRFWDGRTQVAGKIEAKHYMTNLGMKREEIMNMRAAARNNSSLVNSIISAGVLAGNLNK